MRPTSRLLTGLVLVGSAPFALSCAATPVSGVADGPPTDLGELVDLRDRAEVTITMADNVYTPRAVQVSPGTTVTFENDGANVHNATPNEDGPFPAVSVSPGESGELVVPTAPGTYRFFCTLHATSVSGLQRGAFVVG